MFEINIWQLSVLVNDILIREYFSCNILKNKQLLYNLVYERNLFKKNVIDKMLLNIIRHERVPPKKKEFHLFLKQLWTFYGLMRECKENFGRIIHGGGGVLLKFSIIQYFVCSSHYNLFLNYCATEIENERWDYII